MSRKPPWGDQPGGTVVSASLWLRLGQRPASAPWLRTLPATGGHPGSIWLLRASGLVRSRHRARFREPSSEDSGPSAAQHSFLLLDSWASPLPVSIFAGPKDCPSVKARPRRAATWPVSQDPPEPRTVPGTRQMHVSFPGLFPPIVSTEGTTSSTSGIHSIGTERTEGKAELCHRRLGTPSPSGLQPARHTTGHTEQQAHSCPCPRRPRWSACFRSRGPCASPP